MKLLTNWQRMSLIEFLIAQDNLPRCRTLARELVDEAYAIIEEQDYHSLTTTKEVDAALAKINGQLEEAVERFVDLYKLYDHRDACQFTVIRDRGTFRPTPGQLIRLMLSGEAKIDLFEFSKMPDGMIRSMAAPYYLEDLDAPMTQADRDRIAKKVTAWLQPEYQWAACHMLSSNIQREFKKFQHDMISQGMSVKLESRVAEQLSNWLEHHQHLRTQSHNFSVHVEQQQDSYNVVFSPDFELLEKGKHPLDFVRITRDTWTDRMLRSAHHDQTIKQLREKFRNV